MTPEEIKAVADEVITQLKLQKPLSDPAPVVVAEQPAGINPGLAAGAGMLAASLLNKGGSGEGGGGETRAALDASEDAWNFNYKSLIEQHEKFLAGLNKQAQDNLEKLNAVGLQIVQNGVTIANRIQNNAAETDNLAAKQALRNVSYENASIWQLPSIDALASVLAEKISATINPNIPGNLSSPASPVAGSQATGG